MLNVYCDELIGKIVDFQGKKILDGDGSWLYTRQSIRQE